MATQSGERVAVISYRISEAELRQRISATSANWLADSASRTANFKVIGKYQEASSNWSVVKPVYMELQGESKCAYCERKLESVDYGKGEQDVEHFRPKSGIRPWKVPAALVAQGVEVASVPDPTTGYYLLPYHYLNYAAACKPCNSALKRDFFPVAKKHVPSEEDPRKLSAEQPLLIYPISDVDDDAEELIEFFGVTPRPVHKDGYGRARALVTIAFFKLDDFDQRKNLFRERAVSITALFPQLEKLSNGAAGKELSNAHRIIDGFTSPEAPHTNCARSFRRLYQADRKAAEKVFELSLEYLAKSS